MVIYPQFLVLEVSTKVDFAPGLQREMEGIKADNFTNF
jgi:hypothetical protein